MEKYISTYLGYVVLNGEERDDEWVVTLNDFENEDDAIKFAEENDVRMIPIGDNLSIALIK